MDKISDYSNLSNSSSKGHCSIDCEICGGSGWIRREREKTDPAFGSLELCPNVDPFKIYGEKSGLDKVEYFLRWEKILKVNNIDDAIQILKKVLKNGFGLVYLHGANGLGKTLLLQTFTAESIRLRIKSKYSTMANILEELRAAYSDEQPYGEFSRRSKFYCEVPVLCIDEFDRIKLTEFAVEKIQSIVDARYRSAMNRESITIIASNEQPSKYPAYIANRFYDGRTYIIEMKGNSVRPNIPRDER